jgi:hypothetical protein
VYCLLIRYFLVRIRIAKFFANRSKRYRCKVVSENEHTICSWIHHVHTCTAFAQLAWAAAYRPDWQEPSVAEDDESLILFTYWETARQFYSCESHYYIIKTNANTRWYDKTTVCAVQLERKLMLYRNGSWMLKAVCTRTSTASVDSARGWTCVWFHLCTVVRGCCLVTL